MGCNDCQSPNLQGSQYCQECMPDESSVIIPDTIVPDPFLMDRNHIYLLPNGESYILNYDRTQAIKLGGSGGSSVDVEALEDKINKSRYDDTELRNKINELSNKEDRDTIYNDAELRSKIDNLENKTLKYKYVEKSIGTTPLTPTINGDNLTFGLSESVDREKDKLYVSLRTVFLNLPAYTSDSRIISRDRDTLIELPLNNSNDRYVNTDILLKNGDVVHISFKYDINGTKLYINDFTSFIDAGKVTGNSKMLKYQFFGKAGGLDFDLNNSHYYIGTNHYNSMDIFKRTLQITQGE